MTGFTKERFGASSIILATLVLASSPALSATFTVTTTSDSGPGSLREAIASANATGGADRIEFQAGLTGTITLASALPVMSDDVVVDGPGAAAITVSGGGGVRVFEVAGGTTAEIAGLTIADGSAPTGAGISNEGTLVLRDCMLTNNAAVPSGIGGGVDNFGGTLTIERCTISGNLADIGGGVASDTTLSIVETTITDNTSVLGGGIDNSGGAMVRRSTISGNAADFGGGLGNTGQLVVFNSTVSGNSATDSGGGIENFEGEVELEFTTIARNTAVSGAGIWNDNLLESKNSLVVDSNGSDCDNAGGQFDTAGVNYQTDGTCPGFDTETTTAIALDALADNGGPTRTHALAPTSVAVDAAADCTRLDGTTVVDIDQRGIARPDGPTAVNTGQRGTAGPVGTACDAGSYEAEQTDLIFASGFE